MRVVRSFTVIGMNNPRSDDPTHSLTTQPPGGTGHRLWQMARARTGIDEADWLRMTDRRNLCAGEWNREEAWHKAREWYPELRDRTTVLLGADVSAQFPLSMGGILTWGREMGTPPAPARPWILIPHPSGMNRWYNDAGNRAAVEVLLADLVEMCVERDAAS